MRTILGAVLVAVVLLGSTVGVGFVGLAGAQDGDATTRSGGTVIVGPEETIEGDLAITAGTAIVQGTVNGDLSVVGGDVQVEGTVNGDLDVFAGSVRVTGEVTGAFEGSSGNVFIGEGGQVGELNFATGNALIDGTVAGDATVGAGSITLGENAVVQGDFEYDADTFDRAEGATVEGQVIRNPELVAQPSPVPDVPSGAFSVYGFLVNLLLGAVLLLLFPAFTGGLANRVERDPVISGGVGLLTLIVVPLLLLLLAITIIGIPLSILGALLFALVLWLAFVLGAYAVGDWLIGLADSTNRWLALIVGLLAVAVLNLIPILGGLVNFLVLLLGLGAFALGLSRSYRGRRAEPERVEREPREEPTGEPGDEAPGA